MIMNPRKRGDPGPLGCCAEGAEGGEEDIHKREQNKENSVIPKD